MVEDESVWEIAHHLGARQGVDQAVDQVDLLGELGLHDFLEPDLGAGEIELVFQHHGPEVLALELDNVGAEKRSEQPDLVVGHVQLHGLQDGEHRAHAVDKPDDVDVAVLHGRDEGGVQLVDPLVSHGSAVQLENLAHPVGEGHEVKALVVQLLLYHIGFQNQFNLQLVVVGRDQAEQDSP